MKSQPILKGHGVKVSPLKVTPLIHVISSSTTRSQCHMFQPQHCTHSSSPKAKLSNLPSAGHPNNICWTMKIIQAPRYVIFSSRLLRPSLQKLVLKHP